MVTRWSQLEESETERLLVSHFRQQVPDPVGKAVAFTGCFPRVLPRRPMLRGRERALATGPAGIGATGFRW